MEEPLIGKKFSCFSKHWKTIVVAFVIVVAVTAAIVLAVVLTKNEDSNETKENKEPVVLPFQILKNDSDLIKPNIKFNCEFQLVKTKNGMVGLLLNYPYSDYSEVYLNMPNGSYTETVPGIAHFGEHMVLGGCEKYPNMVPVYNPIIGGLYKANMNAATFGQEQYYYMKVPYTYLFEQTIDLMVELFRYPFYDKNTVKKEIQAVNSEFYLKINSRNNKLMFLLQHLSSTKTSFNGMFMGNNETLNPEKSEELAKKLRGYHSLIKRPENIFFTLLSNETMHMLENYTEKYFTYKMHEYNDNEIDLDDQKKLIENAENIKKFDIFDENLYNHGFFFNSEDKTNILLLFFNIKDFNYKDLQFEVVDYLKYLFNSEYLKELLIKKNYLFEIEVFNHIEIENNNIISVYITLTDEGLEKIDEVLLIVYKYIEILKNKGYEKKYFEDFIKMKKNMQILQFNKNIINNINSFLKKIIRNYRLYGVDQIFTDGTPSIDNYNEIKIKEILNKLEYEKSFFGVNTGAELNEYKSKSFLNSTEIKNLKYYNKPYIYGKMPDNFKTRIKEYINENIKIREINGYFSEKYERVVPCFKETPNNCSELNEFDYLKEDRYNGTKLEEENKDYQTFYQIDKSSESHIVHSLIEINLKNKIDNINGVILKKFLEIKKERIDELNSFKIGLDNSNCITIEITSFSDNTKKILTDYISKLKIEFTQNDINYLKSFFKYQLINNAAKSLYDYTTNLYNEFMVGKKSENNVEQIIGIYYEAISTFSNFYIKNFIDSIDYVVFKIAGYIDKDLVQEIHNYIKNNLKIAKTNNLLFKQQKLINEGNPYIINFYQKSEKHEEYDNSIYVKYKYEEKYLNLMIVLNNCIEKVVKPLLRFNFSNAYSPQTVNIGTQERYFCIYEQGRYKDVDGMEDDINEALYMLINKKLDCPNYMDILNSHFLESNGKIDKDDNYLFEKFKNEKNLLKTQLKVDYLTIPDTFNELIDMVSPVFLEPKRFTFLVVRANVSDEDFEKLISRRKENYKYKLNETISVEHTEDISYWVNRNK